MSLQVTLQHRVDIQFSQDADVASLKDVVSKNYQKRITDGTGNQQAEEVARERISIGVGATVTRDLQAMTNPLGNAVNFAKVKALIVVNHGSANSDVQTLTDGEDIDLVASTFPGLEGILEPGDWASILSSFAGVTIGAGNKDLSFENVGAGTIYVDLYVIGHE